MRLMKRRSYQLAGEMLFLALPSIKKDKFINSFNLKNGLSKKYIIKLLRNELLENKHDRFHTTKKGVLFLETYQKLEDLWNAE